METIYGSLTQSLTTSITTWYPNSEEFAAFEPKFALLFATDPCEEFDDKETFLDTFLNEQLLKFGIVQL